MHSIRFALASLCLVLLSLAPRRADDASDFGAPGLVTLYAHDDLQSSFDFRSGHAGGQLANGEIRLEQAQIAFDVFAPGQISFGFVRDDHVDVLDLGEVRIPPQFRARDRTLEFPLALFHVLFFDGVRFGYFGPGGDRHPLPETDRFLASVPSASLRHVEPVLDHTYLVRAQREGVGSRDELFAFQVVGLVPDQSLTIRWDRLGTR